MRLLYEGKTKKVYELGPNEVLIEFKDVFTAFDGKKVEVVEGKGDVNAEFTELLMSELEKHGVPTHFLARDGNKVRAKRTEPLPLEFIVRNYAYGSLLKRLPILSKGEELKVPVFEVHYKNDELHDPLLSNYDPVAAGILSMDELNKIEKMTFKINEVLKSLFMKAGYKLVDFKVEYGRTPEGELILIDELSPDSFRAHKNGEVYDKDLFRKGSSGEETLKRYVTLLNDLRRVVQ